MQAARQRAVATVETQQGTVQAPQSSTTPGGISGSARGSARGSVRGDISEQARGATSGSARGSVRGEMSGSARGATSGAGWPYETTQVFPDSRNESLSSKNIWKPKSLPANYATLESGWQYFDEYCSSAVPNVRMTPLHDDYLWANVFGQRTPNGQSLGQPGAGRLQDLRTVFSVKGLTPEDVPIVVALDVERSPTTMNWRGADVPAGMAMVALVPTQVGLTFFDPLEAQTPNQNQRRRATKFNVGPGNPIPPGDRGEIWRACGLFHSELVYLEVEAQYYHTIGKMPRWVKNKEVFVDSGSFTFHEAQHVKMADMKRTLIRKLSSLRDRGMNGKGKRNLIFVLWSSAMEIGAFRMLGLFDYLPDGKLSKADKGWVRWMDLQQHPAVQTRTATVQRPGESRSLTNYVVYDLGIHTEEQLERFAHNAGMNAAFTMEAWIATFTMPRERCGGSWESWAAVDMPFQQQPRNLNADKAAENIEKYDEIWRPFAIFHRSNFRYADFEEGGDFCPAMTSAQRAQIFGGGSDRGGVQGGQGGAFRPYS